MARVFTIQDLQKSACAGKNPHLFEEKKEAKKSKYKNQKLELDGHLFDSKREARRYLELRIMLTANIIKNLLLQVPYELNDGGTHSLKYIADFVYEKDGRLIVEDAKGAKTKIYLKKRRLMKEVHGIEIKET